MNQLPKAASFWLNKVSLLIILAVVLSFRVNHLTNNKACGYSATSWDAFGYYMYLPSIFIYHDIHKLEWVAPIDSAYHLTGGKLYQAIQLKDGNFTNKYLGGVAILQMPFFAIGHLVATQLGYPADGFSAPYQYAIMFGSILWFFLGLLVLNRVLLKYFDPVTTSISLLLLTLASNLMQYVSIDGAMSHAFIFPLYSFVLWATIRWHRQPSKPIAFLIGGIIGLACICRPTEIVMLFIPLWWNCQNKEFRKAKWAMVLAHKPHIYLACLGALLGAMPQLIYWKLTTSHFMFDVGSKWYFLNPYFRVLFGTEIGWFIYTPVAIMMVAGFWFMRAKPFRLAVFVFCILNIWVIISWADWRYGATYSTRALTQSYPVFALPLACLVEYLLLSKKRIVLLLLICIALFTLNYYQLGVYNNYVLSDFSPIVNFFR